MRVAIHHPATKGPDGEEIPGSVSAFRVGRIQDHTDLLTGETTPRARVAEILAEQAAEEFPDCTIVIEHLHDNGDDTSTWNDHPPETPEDAAPAGEMHEQELGATQAQAGAVDPPPAAPAPPTEGAPQV